MNPEDVTPTEGAPTAAPVPAVEFLPRSRQRALGLAALTLWLPTLLPLVLGILKDCDHCLRMYLMCLLAVPGMIFPVLLQLDDFWFGAMAVAPTLAAFAGLYFACRELPRAWLYLTQGIVITLVAFEAIGFAYYALRA